MGTRGLWGLRKNGMDKVTYNHYDSYPDCLGDIITAFVHSVSDDELNEMFERIELVEDSSMPTPEQIKHCEDRNAVRLNVSNQSNRDWYCLLHSAQNNPELYIGDKPLRYMIDSHNFILDSLFCEYAYIINLDEQALEFYVGYQEEPDPTNRYGITHDDGYYPCKMLKAYPFDIIRSSPVQEIIEHMNDLIKE